MQQDVLITFDVDWCPDWMIDQVSELLIRGGVKSAWFVTHASPSIDKLRKRNDLFELGIHPNCQPGSSHGSNEKEALQCVKAIVPEAVSMRSHGLYQTTAFLMLVAGAFGRRLESNVLLPGAPGIVTSELRIDDVVLRRVPFFWEDDLAIRDPQNTRREAKGLPSEPGLKVFAFHPLLVVLNGNNCRRYKQPRQARRLPEWTKEFVEPYRSHGVGAGTVLKNLIAALSDQRTLFLKDLLSVEATAAEFVVDESSRTLASS